MPGVPAVGAFDGGLGQRHPGGAADGVDVIYQKDGVVAHDAAYQDARPDSAARPT